MSLNTDFIVAASLAIHRAIIAHELDIESLDRAIGDGDHYINMKRAAETIANMQVELSSLDPAGALNKIGLKLLSTLGGASGPLFSSFFMNMAKHLKEHSPYTTIEIATAFAAGVQAVMQRGKAQAGEKTMLDVLIPVSASFSTCAAKGNSPAVIASILKQVADDGLASTRDMLATKGRAASLGERAIGHLDAGAKSCQVMTHAVCDLVLEG